MSNFKISAMENEMHDFDGLGSGSWLFIVFIIIFYIYVYWRIFEKSRKNRVGQQLYLSTIQ